MDKYKITKAFATTSHALCLPEDEVWAEEIGSNIYLYSPKTRKRIGYVKTSKFNESAEKHEAS